LTPQPISPELQQAVTTFAAAAAAVSAELINHVAHAEIDSILRLQDAQTAGNHTMLAIDMATTDPQVRLISVGSDQIATQIAALGLLPASDWRNLRD